MTNPDFLRGPWQAVISHRDYAFDGLDEAIAARHLVQDGVTISVRRFTALPVGTELYAEKPGDVAYELEDVRLDDTTGVGAEARWAQAQAMAAGLNAAGA